VHTFHRRGRVRVGPYWPGGPNAGGHDRVFENTVFNYPTLAKCHKAAAFDGLNKLPSVGRLK